MEDFNYSSIKSIVSGIKNGSYTLFLSQTNLLKIMLDFPICKITKLSGINDKYVVSIHDVYHTNRLDGVKAAEYKK